MPAHPDDANREYDDDDAASYGPTQARARFRSGSAFRFPPPRELRALLDVLAPPPPARAPLLTEMTLDGALLAIEQLQLAEAEQVARTVQPFLGAVPRHFVVLAQEGRQAEGLEMRLEQQGRFRHHSAPRSAR